ncbi:MAG: hypothetical protein MZU95_09180 [Desulfomicrobium escambiense]|nr:hypothetical protein [Desulfomicrobium escambiense]
MRRPRGLYFLSVTEQFTVAKGDLIALASTVFWTGHILFLDTLAPSGWDPGGTAGGSSSSVCGAITMAGAFAFEVPTLESARGRPYPYRTQVCSPSA